MDGRGSRGLSAHNSCRSPHRAREAAPWLAAGQVIGGRGGARRLTLEPLSQNALDSCGIAFYHIQQHGAGSNGEMAGVA